MKLSGQTGLVDNRLHPLLLSRFARLNPRRPLGLCRAQNVRQMHALLVERIGIGGCETRLRGTEEETVWETSAMHAVKCCKTISPFLRNA